MTRILVPKNFRDRWFSKHFGAEVQELIRHAENSIEIDFSECEWIDPIPAMSMLCLLRLWASLRKDQVLSLVVKLGQASTRAEDQRKSRARLFLASHGFLRAIVEACPGTRVLYDSSLDGYATSFDQNALKKLEEAVSMTANCNLLYGKDPAFPPTLLTAGQEANEVASFVDGSVQAMDAKLFSGRQSEFLFRDSALVRVRQVATEIILNASEHAYAEGFPGPICIYSRVRQHNDHLNEEDAESTHASPLIDHIQDVTSGRYIELFICDIGFGLIHHDKQWVNSTSDVTLLKEIKDASARKEGRVAYLLSLAFRKPISRHKRGLGNGSLDRSNVTGLSHVNTVLSNQTDRSRVFVSPAWTAGGHPRPPGYHGGATEYFANIEAEGVPPIGSFFHFAIGISDPELSVDGWLAPPLPEQSDGSGYQPQEAFRECAALNMAYLPVFDLASLLADESKPASQSIDSIRERFQAFLEPACNVLVIRMSRDFRKNLTDALVHHWLNLLPNPKVSPTLAFCDLSRAQAILLAEHLQTLTPANKQLGGAPRILILSEDLISRTLLLTSGDNDRLWFKPAAEHDISLLLQIIRTLRHFDSRAFWERVSQSRFPLLLRNVYWSSGDDESLDIRLPTYLDYSLAVQDRDLAKIVRRALRRALAVFPGHKKIPIDDLIRPDLADASRWMARPPGIPPALFVISSVVTGSTVEREARHRDNPAAVLACFFAEAAPPQPRVEDRFRYYSALEWTPRSESIASATDVQWEREPGTPFVRPFIHSKDRAGSRVLLVRPISRIFEERGANEHVCPSAAESYHEWHRDQLLKIGHWSIDRRHGLIEINHLGALQMSAVSGRGFYEWLCHELEERSKNLAHPLLVYPPGRLNAVMVRHLFKLKGANANPRLEDKWRAVPISYLPDIGDGLKQITPLAEEHIRTSNGAIGGTVFFLDIGYVGNRTFRHTQRQLKALGIGTVVGFGLLNRTSAPALTETVSEHEVQCYWRLDVPSLDDERSCPICSGLKAMETLLERTRRIKIDSCICIQKIFSDWDLSDSGQRWEDHGLTPMVFKSPFRKKFGFKRPKEQVSISKLDEAPVPGQQALFTPAGSPVPSMQPPVTWWPRDRQLDWQYVWIRDSAQAAAYAIEIARTLAAPAYPLRLARDLAEPKSATALDFMGVAAAIEVLSCYLLLTTHELTVAVKEAGGTLLLRYLAKLETAPASFANDTGKVRLVRLRGLASLALINLGGATKRLLLDEVVSLLTTTRMVSPETRIALMAVIMDAADDGSPNSAGPSKFDSKVMARLESGEVRNTDRANVLRWNYWLLTISEHSLLDQFEAALKFFGAGPAHGDCIERLKDAENDSNQHAGWALCRSALQSAHALICRGRQSFSEIASSVAVPGELFDALCELKPDLIDKLIQQSRAETFSLYQTEVQETMALITSVRDQFQGAMIRFDPNAPSQSFNKLVQTIRTHVELAPGDATQDIYQIHQMNESFSQAGGARYLLVGKELRLLLKRLANDALRHAPNQPTTPPQHLQGLPQGNFSKIWILISGDDQGQIAFEFWNRGMESSNADDFKRREPDLAPVHQQLGTKVIRTTTTEGDISWYCTTIVPKWIQGGKS